MTTLTAQHPPDQLFLDLAVPGMKAIYINKARCPPLLHLWSSYNFLFFILTEKFLFY